MDYRNDAYRGDESTKRPLRETGAAAAVPPIWSALFRRAEVSIERLIRKDLNRLRRQPAGARFWFLFTVGRGHGRGTRARRGREPRGRSGCRNERKHGEQDRNPQTRWKWSASVRFLCRFSEPKTDIKPIRQFVRRRHEKSDTLLRVQAGGACGRPQLTSSLAPALSLSESRAF